MKRLCYFGLKLACTMPVLVTLHALAAQPVNHMVSLCFAWTAYLLASAAVDRWASKKETGHG